METKYYPLGINGLMKNKLVPVYFKNLHVSNMENKVFTLTEIQKIEDGLLYDVWNELVWVEEKTIVEKENITESLVYQIIGFNMDYYPARKELVEDTIKEIEAHKFYNRAEIETLSAQFGYSVYDCFIWQIITVQDIQLNNYPKATKYLNFKDIWEPSPNKL